MTTADKTGTRRAPVVRAAVLPSVFIGLACSVVGATTAGNAAVSGALLGTVLVVGFFGLGHVVLSLAKPCSPSLFLVIGLLTYALQVVVLLAVLASFARHPGWTQTVDTTALAGAVIACTACWTVGLVVAALRQRALLYDVGVPR